MFVSVQFLFCSCFGRDAISRRRNKVKRGSNGDVDPAEGKGGGVTTVQWSQDRMEAALYVHADGAERHG